MCYIYIVYVHLHLCIYVHTMYAHTYVGIYSTIFLVLQSTHYIYNLDYANIYNFSGSRPSSSSILTEVQELLKAEDELQEKKVQLSQTEQQLEAVQRVATKWVPACMYL